MQFEVEVPEGAQPGQVFMAQTPDGEVPVKVPQGAVPGQRMQFQAPTPGVPILLGRGNAGVVQPARVAQRGTVVQGYRVDPFDVTQSNMPLVQGRPVPDAQVGQKINEIRKGGELARSMPLFPTHRPYRDVYWTVAFAIIGLLMLIACIYFANVIVDAIEEDDRLGKKKLPATGEMAAAAITGGVASLLAAFFFVFLMHTQPALVVWTSLLFTPTLLIIGGLALVIAGGAGGAGSGAILILLGVLLLVCVVFCFRHLIPFTILLVKVIGKVMAEHPFVVMVAVVGSLAGILWTWICAITFVGAVITFHEQLRNATRGQMFGITFVCALIFIWGAQVVFNVCHVTYCGLFGRWYAKADQATPLRKSLRVALTTSFGSICFGSFVIAFVRAIEAVLRQARAQAQQDGNPFCCILLLMLECVVRCIGDILEYFSEWAFVQCAVRGASFLDAARITYSMCTCANLYFVIQDLLVNAVVNLGAMFCGIVGAVVGGLTGLAFGNQYTIGVGIGVGALVGILAGGSAAGVISSGAKTVLALWAEDANPLMQSHPELHNEFEEHIVGKLGR